MKKISILALTVAGLAAWAPPVLEALRPPASELDERPDPGDEESPVGAPLAMTTASVPPPRAEALAAPAPASLAEPIAVEVDADAELLAALATLGGRSDGPSLSELLDAAQPWSRAVEAESAGVREPLAEGPGPSAEVQGPEHGAAEVAALLARTDLSAIVVSSDRAWALIDGRILKVGETLSPELARLIAIEPGGVVLETPVGRRRLELPPLRPAPRATGSDPAEDPSTDAPSAELEALELDGAA